MKIYVQNAELVMLIFHNSQEVYIVIF